MNRSIVVMGPSGCGKSTLARALAEALRRPFVEGDELHPDANRAKMARGEPLTDADRAPFLDAVALALTDRATVASCSALKRAYRDRLRAEGRYPLFVHPVLPRTELEKRIGERRGHFMPPSQLADQLATLEPLEADEGGIEIDGTLPVPDQVAAVRAAVARESA